MTNNDKFYETFGVHMTTGVSLCDICDCKEPCRECALYGHGYSHNQYVAPKKFLGPDSLSELINKRGKFKDTKQLILDTLSKESDVFIATAYLYTKNFAIYGIDVSEKWNNVAENSQALAMAYNKGWVNAMMEHEDKYSGGQLWFPVRKRLPGNHQRVLVTITRHDGCKVVRIAEYNSEKMIFNILENSEEWEANEKGLLAWMPLPEPYETDQEVN